MIRSRYVIIAIVGFGGGVLLRSFFEINIFISFISCLLGGALCVFWFYHKKQKVSENFFLLGLFVLCAVLGVLRFSIADLEGPSGMIKASFGESHVYEGIVIDEVDRRDKSQLVTLSLKSVDGQSIKGSGGKNILIFTDLYPEYQYGDLLKVKGVLKEPLLFASRGTGRSISYGEFLKKDGIFYTVLYPKVTIVDREVGNIIRQTLFHAKTAFLLRIGEILPEPESSLLGGIILGAKHSLGKDLLDLFTRVGIIHIVVLSGYNIALVAELIRRVTSFLGTRSRFYLGVLSIVLFILFAGGGSAAIRAGGMVVAVLYARYSGRFYDALSALFVIGALMVLWNPYLLAFDPSFQLSFLATYGLIMFTPFFEKHLGHIPNNFKFREILATTLGTQCAVTPLLLYMTGQFSLVSLLANILILPVMPAIMLLGLLGILFALLMPFVGAVFLYGSYAFLVYIVSIATFLGSVSFATIPFMVMGGTLLCGIYVMLLYFSLRTVFR